MGQEGARLSPHAAAAEIDRMSQRVRAGGRWQGWMWLIIGVATFTFYVGTGSGSVVLADVIAPAFGLLGVASCLYAARQRVVDRVAGRIERPVTGCYVAVVVRGVVLKLTVLPDRLTPGLVIVAVIMAVPGFVGAWLVLHTR